MIDDLPGLLAALPNDAVACVSTTWALAYLQPEDRERFAANLAEAGRKRTIVWISGEGPGIVPAFSEEHPIATDDIDPSVLGAIVYEGHAANAATLAYVHPHGANINWLAPS